MEKLWKCPRCGREFIKTGQPHSCRVCPPAMHFVGKGEIARELYAELKNRIKKNIGPFKVDSIQCCIHLVKTSTFAAVLPGKDKIKIHFTLEGKLKNKRVEKITAFSTNRYLHSVAIETRADIDTELLGWLKRSYALTNKNV